MFDARQVANEILQRAWSEGLEITQLQINKIVYFLHGHHLRDFGEPLVKGEFQAWQRGPVHTALRAAFKSYGDRAIDREARRFDPVRREMQDFERITDNRAQATIDNYLETYLGISAWELMQMTHAPGTPWDRTMRDAEKNINIGMIIENGLICDRFEGISPK